MTTDKFIDAIKPFGGGDVLQTSLSIRTRKSSNTSFSRGQASVRPKASPGSVREASPSCESGRAVCQSRMQDASYFQAFQAFTMALTKRKMAVRRFFIAAAHANGG